jgi:hypothetical protein
VIASVSGNDVGRSCFRIIVLNCCPWSTLVRWCPSPLVGIVTQLVTHLRGRGQTDPSGSSGIQERMTDKPLLGVVPGSAGGQGSDPRGSPEP